MVSFSLKDSSYFGYIFFSPFVLFFSFFFFPQLFETCTNWIEGIRVLKGVDNWEASWKLCDRNLFWHLNFLFFRFFLSAVLSPFVSYARIVSKKNVYNIFIKEWKINITYPLKGKSIAITKKEKSDPHTFI